MPIFRRKYVFETKHTRLIRVGLNAFFGFTAIFIAWNLLCSILLLSAGQEKKDAHTTFYNKPPDLIVVFTGDAGRIPYALQIASEYKQPNIFITGVYQKSTVDSILARFEEAKLVDTDLVDIDYEARNTIENVIFTLRYLRENPGFEKILIVSNDYHIMRSKLIMDQLKSSRDPYEFHYVGIDTDYTKLRNIKILYVEFFKLLKSLAVVTLWDSDIRLQEEKEPRYDQQ